MRLLRALTIFLFCLSSQGASGALLWSEDAENGTAFVIDGTDASYPLIQSNVVARGNNAFHLANPGFQDNWFVIDRTIRIQPDTKLFFLSQLRAATSGQTARVQISTNGGSSWGTNIFGQAGADFPGEGSFSLKEINLATYANQDLRFRFYYDHVTGAAYTGSSDQEGWFLDGVQIGSAFEKIAYSIGNPSNEAQLYLEFINRARADAMAEATRLANTTNPDITSAYSFFGVTGANIINQFSAYVQSGCISNTAQPLVFNEKLLRAAELHTLDMFNNEFQGHFSSSNPPAPFQPGDSLGTRLNRVGYSLTSAGENVFAFADSVEQGHAGFNVDWGNSSSPGSPCYFSAFNGQGMQNPAGHRRSIHNPDFKEIGVGVVNGTNGSVGPQLVTQDFGTSGSARFVTGVVYQDLNGNNFYDIGEGRGGVRIDIAGSEYYAVSSSSGGYAIPVSADGVYSVTFSGCGFEGHTANATVSGGRNVKVDYLALAGLDGDFNSDGVVDAADYTVWRDTRDASGVCLAADGTRNGTVDQLDYNLWLQNFGEVTGGGIPSQAIPEPIGGSGCWIALFGATLVRRRQRAAGTRSLLPCDPVRRL